MIGKKELSKSSIENAKHRCFGSQMRRASIAASLVTLALFQCQSALAQGWNYNFPPYAQNDLSMTMEGLPTAIAILSNDYGMSAPLAPSSVRIVGEPHNGAVLVDPLTGQTWYFPDSEFYGIDDFTYVVSNIFGQVSNVATVTVYVMRDMQPPVIQNFTGSRAGGNLWTFTGTVVDDDPGAITVTFGGVASGTTTTQADGSFSYTIAIPPGSSGYATAQALNDEGIQSAVVNTIVFNR